jgi:pimeloyl-ACP methyl ester carboxylesterase
LIDVLFIRGARVRVRAEGRGPIVALVHGWQGHSGQFAVMKETLLNSGYTVVTFDMPAHGESGGNSSNVGLFMETLQAVARSVGPLYAVVAHSLGATATALALSRGISVSGVVLISPMISFDFALDRFAEYLRLSPASRELAAVATEKHVGLKRQEVDLLRLATPSCPVQVLHDEKDNRTPISHSRKLVSHWESAQLSVTTGWGHGRILAAPQALTTVTEFLRQLPPLHTDPLETSLTTLPAFVS